MSIIADVVDISRVLLGIGRQQETLDNVGHIAEGQRIVPTSDNHALAVLHFLGHTPKVQSITVAKKGPWPQDNCLYIAGEEEAAHQTITLGLSEAIGIRIRLQTVVLSQKTTVSKAIDGMRTGMNEAAYSPSLGSSIEVL